MARKRELSCKTRQSILVLRNEGYSMREIVKNLKISVCTTPFREQHKQTLTRVEREVEGPAAQLSKKISTLESLV